MSIKKKQDEDKMVPVNWRDIWDDAVDSKRGWTEKEYNVYGQFVPPDNTRLDYPLPIGVTKAGVPAMSDSERIREATDALRERAHEAELKAEWWSGVYCGVIVTIGAAILTMILRIWLS